MDVNFKYNESAKADPVVFEDIFAEKPGGGVILNPTFDVPAGTAVAEEANGGYTIIKAYRLVNAVASADTTIKIAKNSGVVAGDIIATAKKGVPCTAVDTSNADYDVVTVTMGVDIANGRALYQAKSAGTSATPIATPKYVTGNCIKGNEGDQLVRLVNGANLREESANIAIEVAELLPTINLV